jgi:DNA repair protein RecO
LSSAHRFRVSEFHLLNARLDIAFTSSFARAVDHCSIRQFCAARQLRRPKQKLLSGDAIMESMASFTSEAVVLRTWPVHESDLIVSIFSREHGRIKGVAKAALKSRKRFGGALEPMTIVRAWYVERPKQELLRLDQLEIIRSPLSGPVDQVRLTVLSFFAELLDQALPEHDPQETIFRLLVSVLDQTTVEQPWMPLTYFQLWMMRLMGLLPDMAHCTACGEALHADEVSCIPTGQPAAFPPIHGNWRNACSAHRWARSRESHGPSGAPRTCVASLSRRSSGTSSASCAPAKSLRGSTGKGAGGVRSAIHRLVTWWVSPDKVR